jgi:hypothetical protein
MTMDEYHEVLPSCNKFEPNRRRAQPERALQVALIEHLPWRASVAGDVDLINQRTWFTTTELKPGKALDCAMRHLPALAAALQKAETEARNLGLDAQ